MYEADTDITHSQNLRLGRAGVARSGSTNLRAYVKFGVRLYGSVTCGTQTAACGDRRSPADTAPPCLGYRGVDAPLRASVRAGHSWRRSRRSSTIGQIDDRIGELLDEVEPYSSTLPHDADDACLVRVARRNWEKKRRIPTDLAAEIAGAQVESYQAWVNAREEEDFAGFRPSLERTLELQRRLIECFAPVRRSLRRRARQLRRGDEERGRTSSIFAALQPGITALVAEHARRGARGRVSSAGRSRSHPQEALSRELIERFGATWDVFRLDLTVHPFAAPVGLRDIRLTTRYDEHDLNSLFTAMHECGHGLYERGSAPYPRAHTPPGLRLVCSPRVSEPTVGERRRSVAPVLAVVLPQRPDGVPDALGTCRSRASIAR